MVQQLLKNICTAVFVLLFVAQAQALAETNFKPIPTQFIAALADPSANSGTNAELWGLWTLDPGPRGVRLGSFSTLFANGGVAPSAWQFDQSDWWLEEHGLIMEQPQFAIPPGKYLVTGDRTVMTALTIYPKASDGSQRWELADGASVYDVTHLRCRSARYKPTSANKACTPANVAETGFPVEPGAAMPPVSGCEKQDYAVIFVVGVES